MEDRERLERLLGGAELQRLRARLRSRFERGGGTGAVTLAGLEAIERNALCGLLGRRPGSAASMRFDIEELDAVLRRAGLSDSLRQALEILDGPVADRAAVRAEINRRWRMVVEGIVDLRLKSLVATSRGLGMLKRLTAGNSARAMRLCEQAGLVLERLPAGTVTRSQLAASLLGNAHALDPGRPVATLVLAALRMHQRDGETEAEQEDSNRSVWATAGVLVNELARPVLFLNLPTATGVQGSEGEPTYLSLRALLRAAPSWRVAGREVFVCENPDVVAIAADALGERAAPLVCTDGMPAAAQRTLITQLRDAGAVLRYHGDFDWPGIVIGNVVMSQFGATPWRFGTDDYVEAVQCIISGAGLLPDEGREADWDRDLAAAMAEHRIAVHEEAVVANLIADLAPQARNCHGV